MIPSFLVFSQRPEPRQKFSTQSLWDPGRCFFRVLDSSCSKWVSAKAATMLTQTGFQHEAGEKNVLASTEYSGCGSKRRQVVVPSQSPPQRSKKKNQGKTPPANGKRDQNAQPDAPHRDNKKLPLRVLGSRVKSFFAGFHCRSSHVCFRVRKLFPILNLK